MLFTFRKLLNHYASATLIDVLHSPFVFGLYNNCIKKNSIIELPGFIPPGEGYYNQRCEVIIEKYKTLFPGHFLTTIIHSIPEGQPFILYLEQPADPEALQSLLKTAHNDSVVIVRNMYRSEAHLQDWTLLKSAENTTASIDLLFMGFVFVRKEQRRQEFRLRLF